VWMGWGVYSEISSGVVWVRSVGVLSCVICWQAVVVFARPGAYRFHIQPEDGR